MDSQLGAPGPHPSPRRLSPSKVRNRGSGELTEFCADSLQGSKQFVRQELAQDPCGHDLLPPPAGQEGGNVVPAAPASPFAAAAAAAPAGPDGEQHPGRAGSLSIAPPCPSPETDGLAVVSSGSSYGASSSQGDSQPGSAASHGSAGSALGRACPLEDTTAADLAAEEGGQGPGAYPAGLQLPQQQQRESPAIAAYPPLPLLPHQQLPQGAAALGEPPKQLAAGLLAAACERAKYPRVFSAPQLEVPEGDVMIGAGRSAVDEVDFVTPVSLSLTPIRTRPATDAAEPAAQEPTPVAYVDCLAPPCEAGAVPKALLRPAITIYANATAAALGAPGGYNPYDRAALGGGGYQSGGGASGYHPSGGYHGPTLGGSSYAHSYGGAPSGPPTNSSGGGYWAACQMHQRAEGKRGAGVAPLLSHAAAPAQQAQRAEQVEEDFIVRVPGGVRRAPPPPPPPADDVDFIVRVPAGTRKPPATPAAAAPHHGHHHQQQQGEAPTVAPEEEVECMVMVPGMSRKSSAVSPLAAAGSTDPSAASTPVATAAAAPAPATADAACSPIPPGMAADAAASAGGSSRGKQGDNLLNQVLKVALLAGVAVAAAASGRG